MNNCECCKRCGQPTHEMQRIIVTSPIGRIEYYCNHGCAEEREKQLTEDKQFRSFEQEEKRKYEQEQRAKV